MPQYDGSIRINTQINTQNASSQLMSLENRIVKTADKIAELRSKMDSLRNTKVPTEEYAKLQKDIEKAAQKIGQLKAQQESLKSSGNMFSDDWKKLSEQAQEASLNIRNIKQEMEALKSAGTATKQVPTEEYAELEKKLESSRNFLARFTDEQNRLTAAGKEFTSEWRELSQYIEHESSLIREIEQQMQSLKDSGKATKEVPTEEYAQLQKHLEKWRATENAIIAEQQKLRELGKQFTSEWNNSANRIRETRAQISSISAVMKDLEDKGKAFTAGGETEEYARLEQQLGYLQNDYEVLQQRQKEVSARNGEAVSGFKRLVDAAKSALKKMIGSFSGFNKTVKSTNASLKSALKTILKYGLGIRSVYALINKFRTAVKEGFANLAQYSTPVNESLSMLKSSLTQLKNSLATAFAPILTTIAPLLKTLIDMISQAATYVGMFIATLTGASTFTKAIAVQEDYAASLEKTGSAAKKAAGALAKFDDLDVLAKPTSGGGGAGAGQVPVEDMFEEVPIESEIVSLADRFKEIMSSLFAPLKEAWSHDGVSVMDSWKHALQEMQNLMSDIGRDFLTMWNEEATVQMFSDMVHIAEDIGAVIGNLAHSLDEAWNKNQIGLSILENIRDIFAIIIEHIRNAADATVVWSENLDFYPLLESVNGLLEALKPLTDTIGEGLEWFWTNVLLPMAGWTIEDAIPAFLDMLSSALDLLNSVLDVFKPLGVWLWENFLQPLGEWAGEAIISAMETITDLLTKLGDWISDHSEAIQKFISIAAPVAGIVLAIANAGTILSAAVGILSGVLAALTSPITLIVAGIAALAAGFVYLYEQSEDFRNLIDGLGERIKALWEEHLKPLFDNLVEMFGLIGEALLFMWEERVKPLIDWLVDVLVPTITDICGIVIQVVEDAIAFVTDIINGIIEIVNGVINILIGIAKGDWQRVWDGFAGVIQGVADVIKSIINAIIGTVEGVANAVVAAVNTMIRAINSISIDIPGGQHIGFNLSEVPKVSIPRLANGAVIRGGNPFMAILGDQPAGRTNIEAPLATIEQGLENVLDRRGGYGQGNISMNLTLNCNGEDFAHAFIPDVLSELGRLGYNVEVLGTN